MILILEEERDRKVSEAKKRVESGGWIRTFWRTAGCLDDNAGAENNEVDCFLCQEKLIVKSSEYDKHLEKQHKVMFGVKEIKKAGEKDETVSQVLPKEEHHDDEAEPLIIGTDAETVKEIVEMKFLPKRKKIRVRTQRQRLFSRKYQVLVEEVSNCKSFNI